MPGAAQTKLPPAPLIDRVIDTDRAYFEMGARTRRIAGATLAWMPGLTGSAAGAVVHRVDEAVVAARGAQWLSEAEAALASVGADLARIYLDRPGTAADALLRRAGYRSRNEIAFVHAFAAPASGLRLSPVRSEADWRRKFDLHAKCDGSSDGHCTGARDWVDLERAKCAHGLEMFIAECDGEAIGTAGLVPGNGVLRLKNLLIRPDWRRRGVAVAILGHAAAIGRGRGLPTLCLFAIAGEPGELLYRAAGMSIAGTQVEWSRPLRGPPQ